MKATPARLARTLLAAAVPGVICGIAAAQTTPVRERDAAIPEIVVTAQRTESLASRTPLAISVLSGEQLRDLGADSAGTLGARLPNVYMEQAFSGLRLSIRGISNSDTTDKGDPSTAFMLDGIYIARPAGQSGNFLDIDRIEVLRGPQGTLYGRNTTAGLVNVISNAPTDRFEGALGFETGTYHRRKIDALLNVPVNDMLSLRAAVSKLQHDPYLNNGQGTLLRAGMDQDDVDARVSAKLLLGRDATLVLRYDHGQAEGNNDRFVPDTNFFTGVTSGKPVYRDSTTDARLTNSFRPPNMTPVQGWQDRMARGWSADLRWTLGPATLYYLGGHRTLDQALRQNYYYRVTPRIALGVINDYDGHNTQDSHELRLATNGAGPFSAQGGLYYFSETSDTSYAFQGLQPVGLPPYYAFPLVTEARSRAVFGQLTWRVADGLRLTAGARRTEDDKDRVGSTDFRRGPVFNAATDLRLLNAAALNTARTTWRLGADYDLLPTTLLYGSLSTGYKAGGFNDGCIAGATALGIACPAALAVPESALYYQPEELRAYEAGLKSRLWGGRVNVNAAAFVYDYTNLQLSGTAIVSGAPRILTGNAGVARSRGLELDGDIRVGSNGRLSYSATALDAHYVSYNPTPAVSWAGRKLDRAPSHVFTLGYEHRFGVFGGQLHAGVFSRRSADYVIAIPSKLLEYRIPAHTTTDATLRYARAGGAWSLLARVRNLENSVRPALIDSFGMATPTAPRTADVRLDLRF